MSSLAASRADNFYYPPEWEPSMGGISKFQGSKGKNQYEQFGIIRFELPFDAWCLKCGVHMTKGLRFNAKKDAAGKYFSTTIWAFSMKCFDCSEPFVVRTNPQDRTYDFVEGLRKHEQEYAIGEAEGVVSLLSDEHRQQLVADPMFRLQHNEEDKARAKSVSQNLADLQALQERVQRSDYDMNAALRSRNRTQKKKDTQQREEGRLRGLSIPLLDAAPEDAQSARAITFKRSRRDAFAASEKRNLLALQSQSIFSSKTSPPPVQGAAQIKAVQQLAKQKVDVKSLVSLSAANSTADPLVSISVSRKRSAAEAEKSETGTVEATSAEDNALSLLSDY